MSARPGLLDGLADAMRQTWARTFPETQTHDLPSGGQTECTCAMTESSMRTCQRHGEDDWLACDGCGTTDTELTPSIAGTWACPDCIGDTAYDQQGDRR